MKITGFFKQLIAGLTCEAFRQQVKDRETNQPTDGHEGSWCKGKLQLQYDTCLNVFVVVVVFSNAT